MAEWEDLSDAELEARLVQRDIEPELAKIMVQDRECCGGCVALITAALS